MNHETRNRKKQGFTLIELLLSMSFLSVLMLAIAMTIIQIGTTYNRGITVKEINQTGRELSETLRYDISSAQDLSDDAGAFLDVSSGGTLLGGRLCLGSYSYVWNYGRAASLSGRTQFATAPEGGSKEVYLVRLSDPARQYCVVNAVSGQPIYKNIQAADTASAQELLKKGDRQLSLHSFSLTSSDAVTDTATGQKLYTVQLTIGAGDISAMNSNQTACLAAGQPGSDLAYCAVQQFTLVIRAGSGVN